MLVPLIELVADECRDTRLDASRPERDEKKTDVKAELVAYEERQTGLPQAIDQPQPKDGVVFPEKAVSQPTAKQRKEIHADDEGVENLLRSRTAFRPRQIKKQSLDQKHGQDVAHSVKAEALAAFVADDVADLARDRRLGVRPRGRARQSRIHHVFLHRGERRLRGGAAQSERLPANAGGLRAASRVKSCGPE